MWDKKYRPLKFGDVLGQAGSVEVLKARLQNGTALDTNYLFWGGPGQGKTTLARILARAVLCPNLDKNNPEPCNTCENCTAALNDQAGAVVEFDAASRGTVEYVRKIVDDLPFAVFGASKRVYVIDECHRMSKDAQDVLLKPLEEKKLVGMFCTTEPEKVRGAIRSRCEEYAIFKVTREDILARLKMVLAEEKVEYEEDAVLTVIDFCGGGVRDTLNKLEMVAQMGAITLDSVREKLNLAAISLYYKILLLTPSSPKEALEYVDLACERVTPEEVASGIAEAAMNSFRLANGMTADFTFADRELGQKTYQLYGDQLVNVTKHFLGASRYSTKIGLVCDVLTLWRQLVTSAPAPVVQAQPTFQPIVSVPMVSAPPPPALTTLPAPPEETAPAPPVVPAAAPAPPAVAAPQAPAMPAPVQVSPPVQVTAPAPAPLKYVPQPKASGPDVRSDGVGPMGQDPCALSELDHLAMPANLPANKHAKKPLLFDENRPRADRDPITPAMWTRYFFELLDSLKGASVRVDS